MQAENSRRSSTFYISKRDNLKFDTKQDQTARFLRDFWELGPFQINSPLMAKIPDLFDFQSRQNIFTDYVGPENEFLYCKVNERIFLIWAKEQPNTPDINPIWQAHCQRLKAAMPQWGEVLELLGKVKFALALFENISAAKASLPRMRAKYGRCWRDNKAMDLREDYSDGGSPSTPIKFTVYSPELPYKDLPGLGQNSSVQAETQNTPSAEELLKKYLLRADNERCRLSVLPAAILADNSQGHWDLYWPQGAQPPEQSYAPVSLKAPLVSRDPAGDIQSAAVAIDFGTSSTVIATRDKYGQVALQRIGLEQGRGNELEPGQFENPTVLHFDDLAGFLASWRDLPCRPAISWEHVQCSHEARHNNSDVHRLFAGLKSWARGKPEDEPVPLQDTHGTEIRISVPGLAEESSEIAVGPETPLNPIELYAFFLGLHLNNQIVDGGRIYTEYYLTFPVKFDRATRQRILASFRRGILRSLPPSLVYGAAWDAASFIVEERANEPAAYAAAVLPLLDLNKAEAIRGHQRQGAKDDITEERGPALLEPTEQGEAFGVFDFGGGTADFAIGLYRLPTEREAEEEGWEKVVEILDTSGDANLGGEHLLDEMAFAVVCANRDKLLNPLVPFSKPSWEDWLEKDKKRKVFCITGEPGTGLSALVAQFTARNTVQVAGIHLCNAGSKLASPRDVILPLAFQMGTRLPAYRRYLPKHNLDLPRLSNTDLFTKLITGASSFGIDGDSRPAC